MGKIILLICLANTGGARNVETYLNFDTMSACQYSLKTAKIEKSMARDTSTNWMGIAVCGYAPKLGDYQTFCNNSGREQKQ